MWRNPFIRCDSATKVKKVTESTGGRPVDKFRPQYHPYTTPSLHSLDIYLKRQPFDVVRDSFHLKWAIPLLKTIILNYVLSFVKIR